MTRSFFEADGSQGNFFEKTKKSAFRYGLGNGTGDRQKRPELTLLERSMSFGTFVLGCIPRDSGGDAT